MILTLISHLAPRSLEKAYLLDMKFLIVPSFLILIKIFHIIIFDLFYLPISWREILASLWLWFCSFLLIFLLIYSDLDITISFIKVFLYFYSWSHSKYCTWLYLSKVYLFLNFSRELDLAVLLFPNFFQLLSVFRFAFLIFILLQHFSGYGSRTTRGVLKTFSGNSQHQN